jgi:hypothetical protein
MNFPRSLNHEELEFIRWLLPETSSVYGSLLWNIQARIILGEGRWGSGDLIMGESGMRIDMMMPMSPVVAYGECYIGETLLTVSVHEANTDEQIEIQFSGVYPLPQNISVSSGWTFSYWIPGMPCPATGGPVREVDLHDGSGNARYTIAISPSKKRLWLYHHASRYNQLLGITAFADELFRTHHIRDAEAVTHPNTMFDRLNEFTDGDLRQALLSYNTFGLHKFDTEGLVRVEKEDKKSFLGKLFNKN